MSWDRHRGRKRVGTRGDVIDFEQFFEESYRRVYAAVLLSVREQELAGDATDEAYARAWTKWSRVSRMEHPVAWVAKVAFNYALRESRHASMPLLATASDPAYAQDWSNELQLREAVRNVLEVLSPQQRAVLFMRYYLDLTVRDTAQRLGIAEGTVKRHCSDALNRLREEVGQMPEMAQR